MATEDNKAIVRRIVEEIWHQGNLAAIDDLLTAHYVSHDPNAPEVYDRETYKQWVSGLRAAFPDVQITIEDMIAEGDQVTKRWTWRGTHRGDLPGIPATGKSISGSGITIYRIVGGKLVENWWNRDVLGFLQQLGVIPAAEPNAAE